MLRTLLSLLFLLFAGTFIYAQGENNTWTFGQHNGLNFNTTPPTFFQSSNSSLEGCSSISDAGGNLLFYSNGNDVWDANGAVMPNGSGILGNGPGMFGVLGSCAQGVAIVKSPVNANLYYLFVQDAAEQIMPPSYPGYLRYSVIDMSLNGGLGDVVATQKNVMLDTAMSEKMTVVKGAGCYYWILAHRNNSAAYRAFKVDGSGVHPAVSSNGVWQGSIHAGQLKVAHSNARFANPTPGGIEIGNFDNSTGMVSNVILMDSVPFAMHLGTAFSPDDSKLYIASYNLVHYVLTAFPNTTAVIASKVLLSAPLQYSNLRNGPDGKIYVAFYQNHPYIGTIDFPNNAGVACGLNNNALAQPAWSTFNFIPGNPYGHGLGNDVVAGLSADTGTITVHDTVICQADTFLAQAPAGFNDYQWSDGNTNPTRTLSASGTYWVYSYQNCSVSIDTFHLRFIDLNVDLGADTGICPGGKILLQAGNGGATYRWQDGSTESNFLVGAAGTYTVKVQKENCTASDTIKVTTISPYLRIAEEDTVLCLNDKLLLHAIAFPEGSYQWLNGGNSAEFLVDKAGTYKVTATNACGTYTDSVTIGMENCDCLSFLPNAFSPNGDQQNDEFLIKPNCNTEHFSLSIYNRYGQRLFHTRTPDKGWDGTFHGTLSDVGTYYYIINFKGPRGNDIQYKGDLTLIR